MAYHHSWNGHTLFVSAVLLVGTFMVLFTQYKMKGRLDLWALIDRSDYQG